jgi:hypothetical protein
MADETGLDACIEVLARTMNSEHLEHIALSREATGDVIVTARKGGKLIKVGWVQATSEQLQWTMQDNSN